MESEPKFEQSIPTNPDADDDEFSTTDNRWGRLAATIPSLSSNIPNAEDTDASRYPSQSRPTGGHNQNHNARGVYRKDEAGTGAGLSNSNSLLNSDKSSTGDAAPAPDASVSTGKEIMFDGFMPLIERDVTAVPDKSSSGDPAPAPVASVAAVGEYFYDGFVPLYERKVTAVHDADSAAGTHRAC